MRGLGIALMVLSLSPAGAANAAERPGRPWWLTPQRMLQTNLREIDATMDVDRYIRDVKAFGASVVLFNVGGIVANYPTELECHWQNTHMKGDLVGTVLERLHADGIRMIGRFDFSKVNETFAALHPDWLYVGVDGRHVNYNGQVHTCVSGGYQQEYMFRILGEAVDRYPLDGVFFNMIGFTKSDYSGNYHGICQCRSCERRFREFCGKPLPRREAGEEPGYPEYRRWTAEMKDRQFSRVREFLKAKRPDLAICTYTTVGVDVIRKESNRPLGRGAYHDTETAQWTLRTCGERQLACAAVHFIRIPYRHSAVSPWLTGRRIWQQAMGGAWLDFYCIGPLQRQEDRTGLDVAAGIYRFHAANERWLAPAVGAAEVGLVRRGDEEFDGIRQILSEERIPYALVRARAEDLRGLPLVIVPDAGDLDPATCRALDDHVTGGGKLLLTGKAPAGLECLGALEHVGTRPREKGAYVRIRPEDRERLRRPDLAKLDLVFLAGPFEVYEAGEGTEELLRWIPPDMFGPPEKCYYRAVSDRPALLHRRHGDDDGGGGGAALLFPFGIGAHYEEQAHTAHANLLVGAIDGVLGLDRRLRVRTSPLVEVTHRRDPDGRFEWVGLYNHSGQRGKALHAPLPIHDVSIELRPAGKIRSVRALASGAVLPLRTDPGGRERVVLPRLDAYEVVLFEYAAEPARAR